MKRIRISMAVAFSLFFLAASIFAFITGMNMQTAISGYVPANVEYNIEAISRYDAPLLRECQRQTLEVNDCFDLVKSIITVTSEGNPSYSENGRVGLIPLPIDKFQDIDLSDTEENIPAGVNYIMGLYDVYNDDLTFASIAYYVGRAYANEVMYILQRNHDALGDDVSFEQLSQALRSAEISLSNRDERVYAPEVIELFYQNLVDAYYYWSDKPLREISVEETLFDYGTYAMYPSFTVEMQYDFMDYNWLDTLFENFFEYTQIPSTDSIGGEVVEVRSLPLFSVFTSYLDNEGILYEDTSERSIRIGNYTIYDGACDPVLEIHHRFVDDFVACLDHLGYCTIQSVSLPTGYALQVEKKEEQLLRVSLTFYGEIIHSQEIQGTQEYSLKQVPDIFAHLRGFIDSDSETLEETSVIVADEEFIAIIPEGKEDKVDTDGFTPYRVPKNYQRFCVEKKGTYFYNTFRKEYAPIQYHLAFSLQPLEEFDWYKTQIDTGLGNCGPATVAMALGFSKNVDIPVDAVRHITGYDATFGGATNMDQLEDALQYYDISYQRVTVNAPEEIANYLTDNSVVIVPITAGLIPYNPDWQLSQEGRHHGYENGHYILLTQYYNRTVVTNPYPIVTEARFLVNDPLSQQNHIVNGEYAGKERIFMAEDVYTALESRNTILVIYKE
jgi:hypothetical protein